MGCSNSAGECRLGTKLTLLVFCCGFSFRGGGGGGSGLTLEFSTGGFALIAMCAQVLENVDLQVFSVNFFFSPGFI